MNEVTKPNLQYELGLQYIPSEQFNQSIDVKTIQPRIISDDEIDREFVNSIKQHNGNFEPVIVAKIDDNLFLISGSRRYLACKKAGLVIYTDVREMTDLEAWEIAITSNLARKALTLFEEGMAYLKLKNLGESQRKIASITGSSSSRVNPLLVIFELFGRSRSGSSELQKFIDLGVNITLIKEVVKLGNADQIGDIFKIKLYNDSINWDELLGIIRHYDNYNWLAGAPINNVFDFPCMVVDDEGQFQQLGPHNYHVLNTIHVDWLRAQGYDVDYILWLFDWYKDWFKLSFKDRHKKFMDNLKKHPKIISSIEDVKTLVTNLSGKLIWVKEIKPLDFKLVYVRDRSVFVGKVVDNQLQKVEVTPEMIRVVQEHYAEYQLRALEK